jgi:hypothetical protein
MTIKIKNITCIRHGHPEQMVVGDPVLSTDGIKQANCLAGEYDLIILSPLRRAIETYVRSNISGKRVVICDEAREQRDNHMYNQLRSETPMTETVPEMFARCTKLRDFILSQPEENICIFSSAFSICYLQQVFGIASKPLGYTEIVKIVYDMI